MGRCTDEDSLVSRAYLCVFSFLVLCCFVDAFREEDMSALCLLSLYFIVLKTDFCEEGMTVLVSKIYLLYGLSFLVFCCIEDRFL